VCVSWLAENRGQFRCLFHAVASDCRLQELQEEAVTIKELALAGSLFVTLMPRATAAVSSFQVAVPFPFVVGSQTLPAGTYVVQRFLGKPKGSDEVGVIVLKADDRHVYKVLVTGSREDSHRRGSIGSTLIFTRFRGGEYLNRICIRGDDGVHQLSNVPPEIAAQGAKGEIIVTAVVSGEGR
jgi:hypothetical protein